ncbi:zinc ABC transporter substrate-binding protein [Jiella endophytica]|uniref:High-affinity zinc uptake system protein ZnuA n=1 Tax=Jiella endophytica TaxID=2558362 RepID=A0A4Y8RU74_9HYPH|nr:zinc ABC transporter substrate-binding protein [Jiella endophytica]
MVGSLIAGLAASSPADAADAPKVVASIKPVASLVSAVMEGVGEPYLIVKGAASPHTAALKPSDATALSEADAIFWIGPQLENFLIKPIDALGGKSDVVRLWDADGVVPLKAREGGMFDSDDDDHGRAEAHDDHDDGDDGHDHEHGDNPYNEHVWLDPENAAAMTKAIAATLEKLDPDHADTYAANAKAYGERLQKLENEVSAELGGVPHKPFVVFHDAYQYFEHRFDVPASGSITVSPEKAPGAARIREIKDKLASVDAACVFSEPEFEPSVVAAITEGTSATTGVLDPLGADLPDGPDLYPTLIKNIADGLKDCFTD